MLETNVDIFRGDAEQLTYVVAAEDAFAFIVRLDDEVEISHLENFENCIVFSGFEEFRTALSGEGGPRISSKPVVILSSDAPPAPEHLLNAVGLHWRYGGKFVLSRAKCSYFCKTGTLQLDNVSEPEMHRAALLPLVITMPVREALLPISQLLLFAPSDGFTVCIPHLPLSGAALRRVEGACKAKLQNSAEFERIAKIGVLDNQLLSRLPIRTHWAVANHVVGRLTDYRQLLRNLSIESGGLSRSIAETTITLIAKLKDDVVYMPESVGRFLYALSLRGDIVRALSASKFHGYLSLSRQCERAEAIAGNLAIIADEICQADVGGVAPLFEFLASSLSSEALNATYSSCIKLPASEEHFIALADSMRNFAHETTAALLLVNAYKATPEWVRKPRALRRFKSLIASQLAPALAVQVGQNTLARIEGTLAVTDRFRAAVLAADRPQASAILQEDYELSKVDFLKWMDTLRGLSNELRELNLRVRDLNLPGISSLPRQRLAAIIFSDTDLIEDLNAAGLLNGHGDLNAVALSLIGDSSMLDSLVNERFLKTAVQPLRLSGGSASEVFENARSSVSCLNRIDGPLVSVVMSAYNPNIDLMKLSLDSVVNQTWKNVEVFVIDDASDRHEETQIRDLASEYSNVELIRLDVNSGPYVGRNLAIEKARGEFIAIQDADDWSHPERLACQVGFLLDSPEARVVASEHVRIDRAGRVSLEGRFRVFGDGPMTSIFRAGIFREIGCFAEVRSRGDVEMRERMAAYYGHQAVADLPLPLVLCYADSGTLSHRALAQRAPHLQLFRSNISRRPSLNNLFRDGIALTPGHQVQVPKMLQPA